MLQSLERRRLRTSGTWIGMLQSLERRSLRLSKAERFGIRSAFYTGTAARLQRSLQIGMTIILVGLFHYSPCHNPLLCMNPKEVYTIR